MSGLCDAHTHFTWTNAGALYSFRQYIVAGLTRSRR